MRMLRCVHCRVWKWEKYRLSIGVETSFSKLNFVAAVGLLTIGHVWSPVNRGTLTSCFVILSLHSTGLLHVFCILNDQVVNKNKRIDPRFKKKQSSAASLGAVHVLV